VKISVLLHDDAILVVSLFPCSAGILPALLNFAES
jgi:hypothetical protein